MSDEKITLREKMSKRISGAVLLATGLILSIILFFESINLKIADPDTAKSVINGLLLAGGSLFGVDVIQKLFQK